MPEFSFKRGARTTADLLLGMLAIAILIILFRTVVDGVDALISKAKAATTRRMEVRR